MSNNNKHSDTALISPFAAKPGRKGKKQYFTKETEDAILLYNSLEDPIERNKVYREKIKYPFEKLAENMIHTFKFYHFDVPYEDVQNAVVHFLNEKIHKYTDPSKGKAFSYFSIVAKNYLINENNDNYDRFKITDQPEAIDENRNVINEVIRDSFVEERAEFMNAFVEYMDSNLANYFKKMTDLAIADSVIELFRNRENIENYNKKALYIMIRDRTGVKTHYITRVVNIIKELYTNMYTNYKKYGVIRDTLNKGTKKSEFIE